jgi:metallo-beta-lactamase family protein
MLPPVPTPSLQFLGAAGTVTGSMHLVGIGDRGLLLDCGLFQGLKELRLRNWGPPRVAPNAVAAVVLSHAHLDHTGYLPLLVRRGFRGPVYCTPGTADLLRILLPDSARLLEEEAERANRHGYSKHHPALPLYTVADAESALARLEPRPYGAAFTAAPGAAVRFRRAGHILGAATVQLDVAGPPAVRVVFSGDLGRWSWPILRDPEPVPEADVLLLESTYGDRVHAAGVEEALARVVREGAARGGAILVPAFAVGRTQELLWRLRQLEDRAAIPTLPVWLDSPMAAEVTDVYARHPEDHDLEMAALRAGGGPLRTRQFHIARSPEESKALNRHAGPVVIIAGSGMATGGRILHHLAQRLPDPRTTVLLVGFQPAGTRGRSLRDGARSVRMLGRDVPVQARVENLDALSAHADREELLHWLGGFTRPPRATYLVHGEPAAADSLARAVRERLGWAVRPAVDRETVALA